MAKAKAKARKAGGVPMDGRSLVIVDHRRSQLQALFPDVFTEGKLDWERLRVALGDDIETADERYHLTWAGKIGAIRALQSPTTATLAPCREESVNFDGTDNLFIEGENLEVLKVLQKAYFGKIKMIYIDPPYNTGSDHFIYPDRFAESKKDYQKRVGDRDEEGRMMVEGLFRKNSRENGHYHSNWLSMIYPRLFLARNLLSEDGVIFVSIDDNEAHNLRLVMNEIFGEENFLASIAWQGMDTIKNDATHFSGNFESVLVYSKNLTQSVIAGIRKTEKQREVYKNRDNDPRGDYLLTPLHAKSGTDAAVYEFTFPNGQVWKAPPGRYPTYSVQTLQKLVDEGRIWLDPAGKKTPQKKTYWNEVGDRMRPPTFWPYERFGSTRQGNKELREVLGRGQFDNPKPVKLIKQIVDLVMDKDSTVLDFFAGSCTTAHAILDLNAEDSGNRKFICVQMTEACDEKSEAHKAGYATIADIGKERIRRVIDKISKEHGKQPNLAESPPTPQGELGFKVFKLHQSNFRIWRTRGIKTEEDLARQLEMHTDPVVPGATPEALLYELLLKSGIPLTAPIERRDGWLLVGQTPAPERPDAALALERPLDEALIHAVKSARPQKFITLDRLFAQNDQLKANTALQLQDANIQFITV